MALVSTADLNTFLQVTGDESLLETYRDIVESEIQAYCDRVLTRTTVSGEVLKYKQSRFDKSEFTFFEAEQREPALFTNNYPVDSLTLVEDTTTVSSSSYTLFSEKGVITTHVKLDDSKDRLKATYATGYTSVSAPADLQAAVKLGVRALYTSFSPAKEGSGNVASKSIKDFSVKYGNDQNSYISSDGTFKPYIASNKHILDRYVINNL